MSKLVTIFGGSGFLGRYIARRVAKQGWRVRVAVRHPNDAMHVKTYGGVGQVEPVFCNIRDDASVAAVLDGADAAVNCVGTFDRRGVNNFAAVQVEGAARIARICSDAGIGNLVHISAIGADVDGESIYAQTKGQGEVAVQEAVPGAVILRPSVMFGTEDGFFNKFAALAQFGPVLPLFGAGTKFQPVWVDDVAQAAERALTTEVSAGVYELGGPNVKTLRGWIDVMLEAIGRRRLVVHKPFFAGRIFAGMLDGASALTLGLFKNTLVTRDQMTQLQFDNVVGESAKGFADLGIEPTAAETVIGDYLWRFRPSGQYDAIKESAKNLKA